MKTAYRTRMCGEIGLEDQGGVVTVCGWVARRRDLGGVIFLDLRDRTGIVQVVVRTGGDEGVFAAAEKIRSEYVVQVTGAVAARDPENVNFSLATGNVEIIAGAIVILDEALTPPIRTDETDNSGEAARLEYRFLDLRKESMQDRLRARHEITRCVREYLSDEGFLEIETPILTKPTPEGARDFLVPSRVQQGSFFALPQSPQLFKQILMISGLDRYFQIARCFRDEDLRQDRQPEFTQIDLEMSFVDQEDVMAVSEEMVRRVFSKVAGVDIGQVPRMDYRSAMDLYGSDKPDLRFGMRLRDVTGIFAGSGFAVFRSVASSGGSIKALTAKNAAEVLKRRDLDRLTEFVKLFNAKGLAWFVVGEDGVKSPVSKFLTEEETNQLLAATDAAAGDVIFVIADKWPVACNAAGQLRLQLAKELKIPMAEGFAFTWVTDFPMFAYSESDGRYQAEHHPFTCPTDATVGLLESNPGEVTAKAYDLVVNGMELGGGSIRIHTRSLQTRVFEAMGIDQATASEKFGFFLTALQYGTPPHGGLAFGLDRLAMVISGASNIREVIAFPKTQNHSCLMTKAPSPADVSQLMELGIRLAPTALR